MTVAEEIYSLYVKAMKVRSSVNVVTDRFVLIIQLFSVRRTKGYAFSDVYTFSDGSKISAHGVDLRTLSLDKD